MPRFVFLFVALAGACLAIPAHGSSLEQTAAKETLLITDYQPGGDRTAFSLRTLDEKGPEGAPILRISTTSAAGQPWSAKLEGRAVLPATKGAVGLVRLYARTVDTDHESAQARFRVVIRDQAGSFPRIATAQFSVDRRWRRIFLPVQFRKDYPAGDTLASLDFGYGRQVLEISGLETVYLDDTVSFADLPRTRASYGGHEPDAPWRKAALERIETLRRGPLSVQVLSSSGAPIDGARVELEQLSSDFEFGTCVPAAMVIGDSPDHLAYRQKLGQLFNAAQPENELKWANWIGEGKPANYREQSLAALRWLNENDFRVRGHVLVWPGWKRLPYAVSSLRGTAREPEIPLVILDHIRDITTATRDLVTDWDVLNEPFSNHDLMDRFGPQIMVDWFKAAHAVVPDKPLYFNDWGNHDQSVDAAHVDHFERTTRYLLDNGAPVGGLGLQAHIGGIPAAPEAMLATLDRYQKNFALPVRITEFDFDTDDESLQAAYTRDFLIAMFSHPSVVGIQQWGFWAGSHWLPGAALYRKDWSERPNGEAYRTLVTQTWRTRASGASDARGEWSHSGFYGTYRLTVTAGNRTQSLTFSHTSRSPAKQVRVEMR